MGNVRAVVSDVKIPTVTGGAVTDLTADVVSASDYYPFGMQMPGRSFSSNAYRYGFNGKEKDEEGLGGGGSTYDYGFRIYNPQIARFLSVDPLTSEYPFLTPYQYASNNPIVNIDVDGLEGYSANGSGWVTNPPSSECVGCGPISPEKYERIKRYYEGAETNVEKPRDGYLYVSQPSTNVRGPWGKGYFYAVQGKPKLEVSVSAQFEGGTDKVSNINAVNTALDDLVEKLDAYPDANITLIANAGTDGVKDGVNYGNDEHAYSTKAALNGNESTTGGLLDARGNAIKNALVERGIDNNRINVKRGVVGSKVEDRKVDVSVNISD